MRKSDRLVVVDPPRDRDLASGERGDLVEGGAGEVDRAATAGRALVGDLGLHLVAVVLNGDRLATERAAERRGNSDDLVTVAVLGAARAGGALLAVPGGVARVGALVGSGRDGDGAEDGSCEGGVCELHCDRD